MKSPPRMTYCLTLLAAITIGCEANHYEIELTPAGESLERQLTCWREHNSQDKARVVSFHVDELARIAAAYGVAVPADKEKKHEFLAEFAERMPDDVGGSGSYTHWDTPLGSVSAYVERFRGNDNLILEVERRQWAVDRIAELLVGWFTAELGGKPELAELEAFLEGSFREDLKNLSLYGWAFEIVSEHDDIAQEACLVRIGQYLSERGYFTPRQLPELTRALQELDSEGPAKLLAQIQRMIASKTGVAGDQPIPECLHFLSDLSTIEASSSRYLRETDDYQRLLQSWEAERVSNPDAEKPPPYAVLEELVSQAFLANFDLFGGGTDQLNVTLDSPSVPFLTNGNWDQQAAQIRWSRGIAATDSARTEFPALLFAFWSLPDEAQQQARFGRVVLAGKELGAYCLWYRGLIDEEANEWDEFVTNLRPGDDLVDRLSEFRFSHEGPDSEDAPSDLASTARNLILPALTDENGG